MSVADQSPGTRIDDPFRVVVSQGYNEGQVAGLDFVPTGWLGASRGFSDVIIVKMALVCSVQRGVGRMSETGAADKDRCGGGGRFFGLIW